MTQFIKDQGAQALFAAVSYFPYFLFLTFCMLCCIFNYLFVLSISWWTPSWVVARSIFIFSNSPIDVVLQVSDRRSRQNPLKQLVLVHFEAHTPDLQVLSKHASIIGTEFDENLLRAIVPPKLKNILTSCLDKLVEKRFIQCLDPQDRTFCFPNQLIQATLYELTPPRYANI